MMTLKRTNSSDEDFIHLVTFLDADLKIRDGEDHDFYNQFNKIDNLKYCIVAYTDGIAVGCGAIKPFDAESMEVKRMYVLPNYRGKGIAITLLKDLENWATELNYNKCVLETGIKQPEAIALYTKSGYQVTENYGQYIGIVNSVCFEKVLKN
uniref:GNAT family N-acetyltransferase n=1 Tax=Gelidibacter sp. TaxID=2018083 RepID=UPI00404B8143